MKLLTEHENWFSIKTNNGRLDPYFSSDKCFLLGQRNIRNKEKSDNFSRKSSKKFKKTGTRFVLRRLRFFPAVKSYLFFRNEDPEKESSQIISLFSHQPDFFGRSFAKWEFHFTVELYFYGPFVWQFYNLAILQFGDGTLLIISFNLS